MSAFDPSILGHTGQQTDLLHAFTTGRLGNAYLFSGPSGVGKRLVALGLSKALVCLTPLDQRKSGAPCLSCKHCKMVSDGVHPDVQLFKRDKSVFSADHMRDDVLEWASHRSRAGGSKIGVLDDVESLHTTAANAFLKTLEEPPERTHWILLTSDVGGTLATIVSRCRRVYFEPLRMDQLEVLSQQALMPALKEALELRAKNRTDAGIKGAADEAPEDDDEDAWDREERTGMDALLTPGERSFLLAISQGSPGALLRAAEDDTYLIRDWLLEFLLAPKHEGGVAASETLLTRITRKSEKKQDQLRSRLIWVISLAQTWLMDAASLQSSDRAKLCNQDRLRQLKRWAKGRDPRDLILVIDRFDELKSAIASNASPKLVAANFMLELGQLRGDSKIPQ